LRTTEYNGFFIPKIIENVQQIFSDFSTTTATSNNSNRPEEYMEENENEIFNQFFNNNNNIDTTTPTINTNETVLTNKLADGKLHEDANSMIESADNATRQLMESKLNNTIQLIGPTENTTSQLIESESALLDVLIAQIEDTLENLNETSKSENNSNGDYSMDTDENNINFEISTSVSDILTSTPESSSYPVYSSTSASIVTEVSLKIPQTFINKSTETFETFSISPETSTITYSPETSYITFSPENSSFSPENSSFSPEASSFSPEISSFRPEVSSFSPETSSFRPEASSFSPETSSFSPEASSYRPDNLASPDLSSDNNDSLARSLWRDGQPQDNSIILTGKASSTSSTTSTATTASTSTTSSSTTTLVSPSRIQNVKNSNETQVGDGSLKIALNFTGGLTTHGEVCLNACERKGYNYFWCNKKYSTLGQWWESDFCSPSSTTTHYGQECEDECSQRGEQYFWCHRRTGGWGYCSPDIVYKQGSCGVDGLYAVLGDCRRYISCRGGRAIPFSCNDGLFYDYILKSCTFEKDVRCMEDQ